MCFGGDDYQKESPYERKLVELSGEMLKDYEKMYIPMEYQQMRDIERYRGMTYKQGATDASVNAARMKTPGTTLAGPGLNPGTGQFMMASKGAQQQMGGASGMGAMAGRQSAEDLYLGGAMDLATVGRGQQGNALGMTSTMAQQQAGQIAAQKAAQQSIRDAQWGAAGSVAGATVAYGDSKGWFSKKGNRGKDLANRATQF